MPIGVGFNDSPNTRTRRMCGSASALNIVDNGLGVDGGADGAWHDSPTKRLEYDFD